MSSGKKRAARMAAAAATAALAATALTGCSAGSGAETIRFTFSKREAIGFMTELVDEYNASQDRVNVEIDTSGVDVVSASFVRGNPPDILLGNYNMEVSRFVERCTLTDLSDTAAAATIRPDLQPLMDQYGVCEGRTSALPFSVMSASVIYNKQIFAEHELDVPTTWSELIDVSETLKAADIDPFYGTFKDDWSVGQGWFDYTIGGSLDTLDLFDGITQAGADLGPDSAVSFEKDLAEPMSKMVELAENYTNDDAASRAYGDGNLAFANGEAAMYLQGPWAFPEIAKTNPDLDLGTFPLPMTENPDDRKIRVNVDLAAMIPEGSKHQEAARDFLEYLFQPEVIQEYNTSMLGFTPTVDAPPVDDPRIEGMQSFYDEGRVYQGASVLIPKTIPVFSYAQAIVLGSRPEQMLATLDADWARLAFRQ